jgi:hypothetical protein
MEYDALETALGELWRLAGTELFELWEDPSPLEGGRVAEADRGRALQLARDVLQALLKAFVHIDGVDVDRTVSRVMGFLDAMEGRPNDADLAVMDEGGVLLEGRITAALEHGRPSDAARMLADFAQRSRDTRMPLSWDIVKRLIGTMSGADAAKLLELAAEEKLPDGFVATMLAHGPEPVRFRLALAGLTAYVPGCKTAPLLLAVLDAAEPFMRHRDRDEADAAWWFGTAVRPDSANDLKYTAEELLKSKRSVPAAFLAELVRLEAEVSDKPSRTSSAILRCAVAALAFRSNRPTAAAAFYRAAVNDGAFRHPEWSRMFEECCAHVDGFREWSARQTSGGEKPRRLLRVVLGAQPDWAVLDPDSGVIFERGDDGDEDLAEALGVLGDSAVEKAVRKLPRALVASGEATPSPSHPSYDTETVAVALDPETGRGIAQMSGRGDTYRWEVTGSDPSRIAREALDDRPENGMNWRTQVRGNRGLPAKRPVKQRDLRPRPAGKQIRKSPTRRRLR